MRRRSTSGGRLYLPPRKSGQTDAQPRAQRTLSARESAGSKDTRAPATLLVHAYRARSTRMIACIITSRISPRCGFPVLLLDLTLGIVQLFEAPRPSAGEF